MATASQATPGAAPPPSAGTDAIARNVAANWLWSFLAMVAGFVLPRCIDDQLGQELLGVWDLGWALVIYVRWLQIGIAGSIARYVARFGGNGRVAKAVLIGAVPPIMVKTESNPGGLPIEVFDGFRAALLANRAQFFRDVPEGPFFGFNRPGAKVSQGMIDNWWRQGMMGGAKAHYDSIKAFSETDFTEDLKAIDAPVLILHGEDDQIVPIADSAHLAIKLVKNGTLKTYPGLPHGMATTHPEVINADLLAFFKS